MNFFHRNQLMALCFCCGEVLLYFRMYFANVLLYHLLDFFLACFYLYSRCKRLVGIQHMYGPDNGLLYLLKNKVEQNHVSCLFCIFCLLFLKRLEYNLRLSYDKSIRPLKKIYMFSVPARFLLGARLLFLIFNFYF